MPEKSYTVEDFVLDREFREWVLHPSKESNRYWKEWLDTHPEKAELIEQAIELVRTLPVEQHSLTEEELRQISAHIEQAIDQPIVDDQSEPIIPLNAYALTADKKQHAHQRSIWRWTKIAASLFLAVGLGYMIKDIVDSPSLPQALVSTQTITKHNPKGQKTTVFLKDGSKVVLNANSKITYSKPFAADKREIILEGEAFFEVAKDADRPFVVHSKGINTTALGTSFNIQAFDEGQVKVSLTTGKVQVVRSASRGNAEVHLLSPGEQLTYSPVSGYTKTAFDASEVLAWKEGIMIFKNADAESVILKLEDWYGVDITTQNESAREWNITARFDNQSLENVLKSLSYSEKFDFVINEKNVLIKY